MRNHLKVVFCILAGAFMIAIFSWGMDAVGKKNEKPSGTPTPTMITPAVTAPGVTTITPKPEKKPTEAPTPTEAPKPTPDPYHLENGRLSADGAVRKLSGISADLLGLPKDITAYKTEVDDWTTVVDAMDCYCVNVLSEEGYLAGIFYISQDGSRVYSLSEEGNFNLIKKE